MELIKFGIFIIMATVMFFLPKSIILFGTIILCNVAIVIVLKIPIVKVTKQLFKILPYVLFTFFINVIISSISEAIWIVIKFLIVCNITYIYSITSTKTTIANTIKMLCRPLVLFNINIEEIEIMVAISLSIIPILKKDLVVIRDVYKYKGIKVNVKNIKNSLSVFFIGIIKRTNQIDEALIARGKKVLKKFMKNLKNVMNN